MHATCDESKPIGSVRWIIVVWYMCSVVGNMTSKMVLTIFEYPVTVMMGPTLVGAVSVPLLAHFLPPKWAGWLLTGSSTETNTYKWSFSALRQTARERYRLCLFLGFLSLTAGLLHRVALMSVSVSFAHTVKAIQPLYACIFSYLIFGSTPTLLSSLSLFFVIVGIMLSVFSENNILTTTHGVVALQMSVAALSMSSVVQKVILVGLDRAEVFAIITGTATLLNAVVWTVHDLPLFIASLQEGRSIVKGSHTHLLLLTLVNATALAMQHFTSLSALQKLSPTSHSMVACMKRVVIIAVSSVFFSNKMGPVNVLGAAIAVAGVTVYERSRAPSKATPMVQSPKAARFLGFLSPQKRDTSLV